MCVCVCVRDTASLMYMWCASLALQEADKEMELVEANAVAAENRQYRERVAELRRRLVRIVTFSLSLSLCCACQCKVWCGGYN